MKHAALALVSAAALAGLGAFQETAPQFQDPLPPGHPPVATAPATPPANPDDVRSIRAVIGAYYDSISGPAGAPRDWDRFQSLFLPQARLVSITAAPAGDVPLVLVPEQFVRLNRKYFEGSGYFERSIYDRVDSFGHIAHVLSTYESRRGANVAPYSRGINSFQLLNSGGRWWIVNVLWDRERPRAMVPPKYLPSPDTEPR